MLSSTSGTTSKSPLDSVLDSLPDGAEPDKHPLAKLTTDGLLDLSTESYEEATRMSSSTTTTTAETSRSGIRHGGLLANAVGRRKRSIAEVWLRPHGSGQIRINGRDLIDYFGRLDHRLEVIRPLETVARGSSVGIGALTVGREESSLPVGVHRWDVEAKCHGGGLTGQAEALRLGISRCLQLLEPQYRPILKRQGLLTRDSRRVEPKKYGRRKARRAFQWVKR